MVTLSCSPLSLSDPHVHHRYCRVSQSAVGGCVILDYPRVCQCYRHRYCTIVLVTIAMLSRLCLQGPGEVARETGVLHRGSLGDRPGQAAVVSVE